MGKVCRRGKFCRALCSLWQLLLDQGVFLQDMLLWCLAPSSHELDTHLHLHIRAEQHMQQRTKQDHSLITYCNAAFGNPQETNISHNREYKLKIMGDKTTVCLLNPIPLVSELGRCHCCPLIHHHHHHELLRFTSSKVCSSWPWNMILILPSAAIAGSKLG